MGGGSTPRQTPPIPPEATRIHGIDDSAVRDAPSFAQAWPELADELAGGVVLGHAIGFDLAVLERECGRAGIAWQRPRTLDTRLLAQVAETDLPGYSLGNLTALARNRTCRSPYGFRRCADDGA